MFSAITFPLYICNWNLTSCLIKGDFACPLGDLGGVGICEEGGEDGSEYGGEGGGGGGCFLPLPPSPFGWLEIYPCNFVFLSLYNTFTISVLSKKAFLKSLSSSDISSCPCPSSCGMTWGVCGLLELIWGSGSWISPSPILNLNLVRIQNPYKFCQTFTKAMLSYQTDPKIKNKNWRFHEIICKVVYVFYTMDHAYKSTQT